MFLVRPAGHSPHWRIGLAKHWNEVNQEGEIVVSLRRNVAKNSLRNQLDDARNRIDCSEIRLYIAIESDLCRKWLRGRASKWNNSNLLIIAIGLDPLGNCPTARWIVAERFSEGVPLHSYETCLWYALAYGGMVAVKNPRIQRLYPGGIVVGMDLGRGRKAQ